MSIASKWRPALWMVVFGVLVAVALLPLLGLLAIMLFEWLSGVQFALRSATGLALLALGSLLIAGLVGVVFLRTLLRPLQELEARTAEIDAGRVDAFREISYGGTREVAKVGSRFFELAQKLSQRSHYLTLFTTHLSHELKTPLTAIQGAAELIRSSGNEMSEEQRERFLDNIIGDTQRLAELSKSLRELARAEVATMGGQSDLQASLTKEAKSAGLQINWLSEGQVDVALSPDNAAILWKQLAQNAADQGASELIVEVRKNGSTARVFVGDDGTALSAANKDQLFDAFFTTRRAQGGTGLGLGIAKAMAQSHGGDIGLSDREGFKFALDLPLATTG